MRIAFDIGGTSMRTARIENGGVGYCCLAELRMYEILEQGKPQTPFMKFGDSIKIEMFDRDGMTIFGSISQRIKRISEV